MPTWNGEFVRRGSKRPRLPTQRTDVTDDPSEVFELSPVHVRQHLHVWRCERECFAVEMPLTGAPLREMLGMRVRLVVFGPVSGGRPWS